MQCVIIKIFLSFTHTYKHQHIPLIRFISRYFNACKMSLFILKWTFFHIFFTHNLCSFLAKITFEIYVFYFVAVTLHETTIQCTLYIVHTVKHVHIALLWICSSHAKNAFINTYDEYRIGSKEMKKLQKISFGGHRKLFRFFIPGNGILAHRYVCSWEMHCLDSIFRCTKAKKETQKFNWWQNVLDMVDEK